MAIPLKDGQKVCKISNEAKCNKTAQNFKTSYLGLGMNLFGHIQGSKRTSLVIGYLIGKEICEFWPNLCPWQLFKEGNSQGILADLAKSAITLRLHILG